MRGTHSRKRVMYWRLQRDHLGREVPYRSCGDMTKGRFPIGSQSLPLPSCWIPKLWHKSTSPQRGRLKGSGHTTANKNVKVKVTTSRYMHPSIEWNTVHQHIYIFCLNVGLTFCFSPQTNKTNPLSIRGSCLWYTSHFNDYQMHTADTGWRRGKSAENRPIM